MVYIANLSIVNKQVRQVTNSYTLNAEDGVSALQNNNLENGEEVGLLDFFIFLAVLFGIVLMAVFSLAVLYCIVRDVTAKLLSPFIPLNTVEDDENRHNTNSKNNGSLKGDSVERYDLSKYLDVHFLSKESVEENLERMPLDEQFFYKQGEDYLKMNPPFLINNSSDSQFDPIMTEQTLQYIEEEGANAWEFTQTCANSFSSIPDSNTPLPNASLLITDKTDLQFFNAGYEVSTWTNLPIPYKRRVYYYECKILELNNDPTCTELNDINKETISIGLTTLPYPDFRLPGRHHHSVSYDSNGDRRLNTSFELPVELIGTLPTYKKGDIIGVGYRCRSGTVFFTKNGKKIKEYEIGHIRKWRPKYLYPCIGSNMACKINVNFGSRGFVYIEANTKKWGYGSIIGMKLPPPAYDKVHDDFILEEGFSDDDDDEEELSDEEWDEEDSGFLTSNQSQSQRSNNKKRKKSFLNRGMSLLPPAPFFDFEKTQQSFHLSNSNSNNDQISLKFIPPNMPPDYSSES